MTFGTRSFRCSRALTVVALIGTELLLTSAALAKPGVVAELQIGEDYEGSVQSIAFDASGVAWMATHRVLYSVRGGRPQVENVAQEKGTTLTLAPGGRIYAWLVHDKVPGGLFTVQLVEVPKTPIAELRLPEFPFGFSTLYLGGAGQLIVTKTPLENLEGLGGDFLYVFWSRDGQVLSKVRLAGRRVGVVDVAGDALLLLGESEAIAFRNDGTQLWKLDGRYRHGALADGGKVALLNPAKREATHEVHVYRDGKVTPVKMPTPVHGLALAADGSDGAVAIDKGELHFVAPRSCGPESCNLRRVPSLPVDETFFITAVRFVDPTTVAVGVIRRTGTRPRFTFPAAAMVAVETSGRALFDAPVTLKQPATWTPSIDVTYGARFFAAHTPHRALFVSLDP